MEPKSSPSAADIPDEFKTPLARLYKALREHGVTRTVFVACMKEAELHVSPAQLDRWVARLGTIGTAIIEEKETGAAPCLGREQRDVTSGWVLHENEDGVEVSLQSFFDFVLKYFMVELSTGTISNYLEEDGFSSRLGQKKSKSFVVDIPALRRELWNWVIIQDFRARVIERDKFASIDFTFTGHRTERRTTFAPKGGPQPMLAERISIYTNCIVTCVWADGKNRTPPILFTFNPAFRRDRNPTKKRSAQVVYLHDWLDKYGISEDRVIYVGKDKGETRKYVRECPDLIRRFFSVYDVPHDTTIFSDEGNSFFEDDKSVLIEVGFKKHRTYPPKVHQFLSPNDQRLHGTSKGKWRNSDLDFSDDVKSCLALLSFLDDDIVEYSKHWWDTNMITLTEEDLPKVIGDGTCKLSHLHKSWKRSYEEFMNQINEKNK